MVNLVTYPGDVVVVTGGCGFVGQSLVRLLLEKYENLAEVIVVDIQMPPKDLQTLMATNKSSKSIGQRMQVSVLTFMIKAEAHGRLLPDEIFKCIFFNENL